MKVTIYTIKHINSLVNKTDMQKSLKKREGCKPAYLKSEFSFIVDDSKINLKWKIDVNKKIAQSLLHSQHVERINLQSDSYNYSISAKSSNAKDIANLIGNYILDKRTPLQIDNPNIETKFINQSKKKHNEN